MIQKESKAIIRTGSFEKTQTHTMNGFARGSTASAG